MNRDYLELLQSFADLKVRYLVIGGYAVIRYTEPRYTKDLNIWVEASTANARRVLKALKLFGAPIANLTEQDIAIPGLLYVFGVPPVRVDILNRLKGSRFATAWRDRNVVEVQGTKINFVGVTTLKKLKRAAGRPQDQADLEKLQGL